MSIDTTNLALYVDAIQNTASGHESNPAAWYDMSGNHNGAATGIQFADNYAGFTGSNNYAIFGAINPTTAMTIEALVSFGTTVDATHEGNSVIGNWESGGYGIQQKNGKNVVNVNVGGTWYHVYGTACAVDTPIHLCGTYDGRTVKFYENGVLISSATAYGTIKAPTSDTVIAIGTNPTGSSPNNAWLTGKVYSARVYTRTLTAQEVADNYAYDWNRFFPEQFYLIRAGGKLYSTKSGTLTEISGTLNAALFEAQGASVVPSSDALETLVNPAVLAWTAGETPPEITATVTGNPYSQTVESLTDMSDATITGIASLTADYSGDIGVQYSVDNKATFSEEMTVADFLNSDADALFTAASTTRKIWLDFIIHAGGKLTNFQIKYKN